MPCRSKDCTQLLAWKYGILIFIVFIQIHRACRSRFRSQVCLARKRWKEKLWMQRSSPKLSRENVYYCSNFLWYLSTIDLIHIMCTRNPFIIFICTTNPTPNDYQDVNVTNNNCNGYLTIQNMHIDRLWICIWGWTHIFARVAVFGALYQQIGRRDVAFLSDHWHSPSGRIIIYFLKLIQAF